MPFPTSLLAGVARAGLALASLSLRAETKTFQVLDLLRSVQSAPNTAAIAAREGFVLHGIPDGAPGVKPHAGDTVTALVQFGSFDGQTKPTQWIVRLRLASEALAGLAPRPANSLTLYTNTGRKFTFPSARSDLTLETLGPISADTAPAQSLPVQHRAISVATDFLGLDLYRVTQVVLRIHGSPLELSAAPTPFPADIVKVQQPRAAALGLTADDLRSFSGAVPALEQFLDIVHQTPDLQGILFQILDKPSLIDVFRSGASRNVNFAIQGGGHSEGREIFWPATPHDDFGGFNFNLVVFGKPVLSVVLFVTTPRPPLLVTAGVVGVVAFSPSKPDKLVIVRVLSATRGT